MTKGTSSRVKQTRLNETLRDTLGPNTRILGFGFGFRVSGFGFRVSGLGLGLGLGPVAESRGKGKGCEEGSEVVTRACAEHGT